MQTAMSETAQLSSLVGGIYDAALDPALWPNVLADSARFVRGLSAGLYFMDATSKSGNIYYDAGGIDPHYQQLYLDTYVKLDPFTTGQVLAAIGEPVAGEDIMPYDEVLETRFYQEWARPQQLRDFVTAVLEKSATSAAIFGVHRHERDGPADEGMRRRMRLIIPHMRRAALIGRVIDLKRIKAATLVDLLEGISAGIFLVDAGGRIVHANARGHAMLAQRSLLRTDGGKLTADDAEAEQALGEVFAMADGGDAAVGGKGIAVPLTARDGEHYVAHVLPLTSGERRRAGASFAAVAAVFVQKAPLDIPSPHEIISKDYQLTPTELRVLFAIVQVGGVPAVAEALGIAASTVKTHLLRLFAKTGTEGQADLVKLVAAYTNPLVG
jgi:DNA-binding CsgD family transcriptional regulator/PAS domain-containing protein